MTQELIALQKLGESIEQIKTTHKSEVDKLKMQVMELHEDVAIHKDGGGRSRVGKQKLVDRKEVQDFIAKTFQDGMKTRNAAQLKINTGAIFKAAETFDYPNFFEGGLNTVTDVFTGRAIDPTLYQSNRKSNLILDHFKIENVDATTLYYMNKEEIGSGSESDNDSGSAAWVESAGQKPGRSFRVSTGRVDAKKVAIFGTVADKLLRDVASFEGWLREDFIAELMESYNDALLNSDGTGLEPLGLKEHAIQFTATPAFDGTIDDPNLIDAIAAMAAAQGGLRERPAKAFVSLDNFYRIHVLKDSQSRYQANTLVYMSTIGKLYIAGVEVVGVDSADIDSDHILMISQDPGFKIKNYGQLVFERGLNGEDFRYDRTSYRAFMEVLSYIPEHRYDSVMYDSITNVIASITAGS